MNKAATARETGAGQPVGEAHAHESAHLHVAGAAQYVDDLPELAGTLHVALGLATRAHARVTAVDLTAVRSAPDVVDVLTAADIPGLNDCGPVIKDDPILATDLVQFYGQPLFAVAATNREAARHAAVRAKVTYEELPAILTAEAADAAGSHVLPTVEMARGDAANALAGSAHRITGEVALGGQDHFYLEGQVSYAVPCEDHTIHVWCSTQHPTEMQHAVAHALGWASHQVSVECRRMGGGFGGKESQSAQFACIAALLAVKTCRPVKIRLDRDDDMEITGKRHDFRYRYEAGCDEHGRLTGLKLHLASRCGFSADLSGPVNDRALFHADNAYFLGDVALTSVRGKTHTVSNTAFRGFGGPQGMFAIENVMDDLARLTGRDPLDVRYANFYDPDPARGRNETHYGMVIEDFILHPLVAALEKDCDYRARRAAIAQFNATSQIIKRGLALTPVKFGISFTATFFNQAGALVHVYSDGTVLVNHGGTEMGQGLYTKVRQIVATELGVPIASVRLSATDTSKVPNTSATAASAGTDLNGKAAQQAAAAIRARLATLFAELKGVPAESVTFAGGEVMSGAERMTFADLVHKAYFARVKLWESGFYKTPKIHYDAKTRRGRPFFYFAYGAAASEVAIDTLTGETRVLRADIRHDVGRSINPAIDLGQIEGGYVQGLGWLTSEELWWRPDGRLMTHAPSTYKIPTGYDCPPVFNVAFHENENVEDSIHKSKAVGEPPLMLALSAFFAIKDAVGAVAPGQPVRLDAPATPESVRRAINALRHGDAA
ncbi:MAG: xanthine dehydrogenase molybdopterin binding subunit [Betaproteobacteria bacterium]|nr:xanthine dehydrogenase molybdopterin binding subunit [Betaproteobacteria bacterium]